MNMDAVKAARDCPVRLTPKARLVLFALATRVDGGGLCWPSVACIQADTGLGRTAVFDALRELLGAMLIARVENGRKVATWSLEGLLRIAPSVRQTDDHTPAAQSATRTDAPHSAPDGLKIGRVAHPPSAPRTETVRHTDCAAADSAPGGLDRPPHGLHSPPDGLPSEGTNEETKKGAPAGGAAPGAPPAGAWAPDDAWLALARAQDPAVNLGAVLSEQFRATRQLAALGFAPDEVDAVWRAAAQRWAETGERPSKSLQRIRLDPALPDRAVWELTPLAEGAASA